MINTCPIRFFAVVLTILFCLTTSGVAATKMPDFVLPNALDGKEVSSEIFEGKALLVTFFATWCPPCVEEIPELISLQKTYEKDGFYVLGLSVDQGGTKAVKKLIKKQAINYPVLMADPQVMQDFGGVYGIPVSFLVNKNGNVVKKYTGYIAKSVLEKDLKKVL